jgi:hypothetical protein
MRGKKIDAIWYKDDYSTCSKLIIVITYEFLSGTIFEIDELCNIIYDSNLDKVKYV